MEENNLSLENDFHIRGRLRTAIDNIPDEPFVEHIRAKAEAFLVAYERVLNNSELALFQDTEDTDVVGETFDLDIRLRELIEELINTLNDRLITLTRLLETADGMLLEGRSDSIAEIQLEIDALNNLLNNYINNPSPETLSILMETIFGYDLQFDESFTDEAQQLILLENLATSNIHIIDHFDEIMAGTDTTGLEIFNQYFSIVNLADQKLQVTVSLGADNELPDEFSAEVPLPISSPEDQLNLMYFGSQVTIGTITHEFFHQLDRYFWLCSPKCLPEEEEENSFLSFYMNETFVSETNVPLTAEYIYGTGPFENTPTNSPNSVITGFVGQGTAIGSPQELFADLGMTAVLDGQNIRVLVLDDGEYVEYTVGWAETNSAERVREYFTSFLIGAIIND